MSQYLAIAFMLFTLAAWPGNAAAAETGNTTELQTLELPPDQAALDQEAALSETCLLRELKQADNDTTVAELKARCAAEGVRGGDSLILGRLRRERAAEDIRSILTPHKRNYFLPVTYMDEPNELPLEDELGEPLAADDLDHLEAKFQLSLKFNVARGLLLPRDQVHFGFTALSFWQAYNRDVSAPFRETNYEPELLWSTPLDWAPLGLDAGQLTFGVSHQSNGRGGSLSRSWNRVYTELAFEKSNLVVSLKPWWRIPESEKDDPSDAKGDDNPDIERYLGHFEFTTTYRKRNHEFRLLLRNNLRGDNKGAVQLEWAFPLWRGIRGYAQYFNGYGESLIDYNVRMERFGVGILLTDLL
ncbi:MAG: phospholipase A [Gammaproteobacteria bacterium]|nr:phospholipase A [Gammaproteobacteria bacterium]